MDEQVTPEAVDQSSDAEQPRRWDRFDLADAEPEPAYAAAKAAIDDGFCVVLPTDTVYGIGADPFSVVAVQRLLDAKERGRDMPPPVLIADPGTLMALGDDMSDQAKRLAEKFWPGPLTLIVKAQPSLRMDLGETRGTIAVRVPDHDRARELLRRTGPMAVSSANKSGQPAATNIDDAEEMLGASVAVYLDAGPTPGNVPSTIIDFTNSGYGKVVRRGALSIEELREVVPWLEDLPTEPEDAAAPEPEPAAEDSATQDAGDTEAPASTPSAPAEPAEPAGRTPSGEELLLARAEQIQQVESQQAESGQTVRAEPVADTASADAAGPGLASWQSRASRY